MKLLLFSYWFVAYLAMGLCVISFTEGQTLDEWHRQHQKEYRYWRNMDIPLP